MTSATIAFTIAFSVTRHPKKTHAIAIGLVMVLLGLSVTAALGTHHLAALTAQEVFSIDSDFDDA